MMLKSTILCQICDGSFIKKNKKKHHHYHLQEEDSGSTPDCLILFPSKIIIYSGEQRQSMKHEAWSMRHETSGMRHETPPQMLSLLFLLLSMTIMIPLCSASTCTVPYIVYSVPLLLVFSNIYYFQVGWLLSRSNIIVCHLLFLCMSRSRRRPLSLLLLLLLPHPAAAE